ncbi:MAG: prepilin-type N-terminal cleavage/methylation domain-containing protein [Deltaproteobacteria bacterium]|nr:prepilin-type N-terminal cleavage/methylation domain-containing protein [Deltaproteobacteria bacterium]
MEVSLAKEKGFTLIELLIVTLIELLIVIAIIGILAAIAIPVMRYYSVRAHSSVVLSECNEVYKAFTLFYMDNEGYPMASNPPAFNLTTFDPLRSQGYYEGNINSRLLNGKADSFDSPDDQGANQEFWLQLTLDADPNIRFLVVQSDNAPLGGGQWLDGVYVFRNGVLSSP